MARKKFWQEKNESEKKIRNFNASEKSMSNANPKMLEEMSTDNRWYCCRCCFNDEIVWQRMFYSLKKREVINNVVQINMKWRCDRGGNEGFQYIVRTHRLIIADFFESANYYEPGTIRKLSNTKCQRYDDFATRRPNIRRPVDRHLQIIRKIDVSMHACIASNLSWLQSSTATMLNAAYIWHQSHSFRPFDICFHLVAMYVFWFVCARARAHVCVPRKSNEWVRCLRL